MIKMVRSDPCVLGNFCSFLMISLALWSPSWAEAFTVTWSATQAANRGGSEGTQLHSCCWWYVMHIYIYNKIISKDIYIYTYDDWCMCVCFNVLNIWERHIIYSHYIHILCLVSNLIIRYESTSLILWSHFAKGATCGAQGKRVPTQCQSLRGLEVMACLCFIDRSFAGTGY